MKKFTAILLVMLMATCLFADHYIGFGNDTFSYGLSDDRDDGCTHSILLGYEGDLDGETSYVVNAHLLCYTLRPMTFTNMKGELEYYDGRMDELRVTGGLSRDIPISSATVTSSFLLGYSFYGNFGGEFLQNVCHNMLDLKEVHLDYSYLSPSPVLLVFLGCRTNGKLALDAEIWGGVEGLMKMGGKVGFEYGEDKAVLDGFIGLEANFNLDNSILSKVSMMNFGVIEGFSLDTGFLMVDYKRYLECNTGFGMVAFKLDGERNWNETDLHVSYGAYSLYNRPINSIVVRKELGKNIHVVLKDDLFSEVYQNAPVHGLSSYTDMEVGFRGGDLFYLQTTVGYGRMYTEDHAPNYLVEDPIKDETYFLTGSLELGVSWMSPLILGSSNLGIEGFCGLHMNGDTRILKEHAEFSNLNVTDVAPYFGVRAVLGLDF